ncbi:MAG: helix-turn-helix domain-containing protein [Clostridiales bacterium]|nr:helix-turn-helix domain-containing protein [Clostridiales bacterium]
MNEKEIKDDFLTVSEAARYLKISQPKLYQLRATEKDFPFHKIGESLRFYKEELKQWVLSH